MQVYTYVHTLLLVLPKRRQPDYEAIKPNKRDRRENGNSKVPVRRKEEKKLFETQLDSQFLRREVGEDEKTFVKSVQRKSGQQLGLAGSHTEQTQPDSR